MPRELTQKQKKFCEYYAETKSVRISGQKAGYAPSTVRSSLYRYLKNPRIIEAINVARVNRIYNAEELLEDLNTAMRVAVEAKKPDQIVKIIELKLRLSGLEELLTRPEKLSENEHSPETDLFDDIEELANYYEQQE